MHFSVWMSDDSPTFLHANAVLFPDGSSGQFSQHATAADCGHSSCYSAEKYFADHRPAAHGLMCVERRKQTLRTRKTSRHLDATNDNRRHTQRSQ